MNIWAGLQIPPSTKELSRNSNQINPIKISDIIRGIKEVFLLASVAAVDLGKSSEFFFISCGDINSASA